MATPVFLLDRGELLGRVVYRMGEARTVGRIVRVSEDKAEVYWIHRRGTTMVSLNVLFDYETLVLEAEQKAAQCRKVLDNAKKAILT
jgi:hypothetical protein